MSKIRLKIVTPEKQIFDAEVEQVNIPTPQGEIGILPHHSDLMSKISPGELKIIQNNKESHFALGEGFLQVSRNEAVIMTDMAASGADIDEKKALEAKERAQKALENLEAEEEYATTLAALEKALAQLKVKRRHRSNS